ncbi:CopG family transcriptional regulator [Halosimplex pelagicum]|uniref:CopG family transcriptional regulator n=1 Tax=Halosimplex pelagicum TaxID=869886 RepID=A0A7D5PAY4_9EURY|nr:CopG family transcriptional regulator [Halosimplex pelagicum]QLH83344.1 CopG family transcriptional regulator [Halosimplex pelagicum]
MSRYVTVSVSMPPEMADGIDEEADKYDMDLAPYVRQILREHTGTPFTCPNVVVGVDENHEEGRRKEGAA